MFARQGYAQACVQEIADEAGVAKPTVYNHLTDKATLFRQALEAAAQTVLNERVAALEPLHEPGDDLRATLEGMAQRLLRLHCDDRSCALRRLLYSEITTFPDALDIVREHGPHRLNAALADRFARLMLTGHLHPSDPAQAAEHFMALLVGPLEARTEMGTRQLSDTDLDGVVRSAVRTFLLAFGPQHDQASQTQRPWPVHGQNGQDR
ncbi:transcriptional regulator, TetR family [Micromonospora marina]|uniref:Transcriptional regulator, TetR family n=1 Tax=Micromonospora marina TaxID=307120 RepID=A0A1C4W5Y9_9ACTN|nr:transcriptional regulator, TetR family [Micromonospora marina]